MQISYTVDELKQLLENLLRSSRAQRKVLRKEFDQILDYVLEEKRP